MNNTHIQNLIEKYRATGVEFFKDLIHAGIDDMIDIFMVPEIIEKEK